LTLFCQMATTFPRVMVIATRMAKAMYHSNRRAIRAMKMTLKAATNPIFFDPAARNAVTIVGAPS